MWFKNLLISGLLLCLFTTAGVAQVVTPSLDSALPAELASAVAWRFGSAFGANSLYRKEKSQSNENEYYYNRSGVLFAYQPGYVIGELYGESITRQTVWDSSTDSFVDSTGSFGKLSLAIRGENRVSVGIGYGSSEFRVIDFDALRNTYYEGSFSIRLFGGFYLAGSLQRVTENISTGDSRKWNNIVAGAALQFGDPFANMFRVEGSLKTSPEADFSDDTQFSTHRKSTTMNAGAEVLFSNFLFIYRYMNEIHMAPTAQDDDHTISVNRYGGGYKAGGFTLGLYRIAGLETVGDNKIDTEEIMVTISYNFI